MPIVTMLAALAVQAARPCSAQEPRDEAAVRAAEDHWVKLLETRDAGGLACLLAPGFTDTNWAGLLVPRDHLLAALPNRPTMQLELSGIDVALHGDIAIVHGLNRQKDGAVRFTDIFLYRDRRWQAVSAQETVVRDRQ